jgi:hypothetical protein
MMVQFQRELDDHMSNAFITQNTDPELYLDSKERAKNVRRLPPQAQANYQGLTMDAEREDADRAGAWERRRRANEELTRRKLALARTERSIADGRHVIEIERETDEDGNATEKSVDYSAIQLEEERIAVAEQKAVLARIDADKNKIGVAVNMNVVDSFIAKNRKSKFEMNLPDFTESLNSFDACSLLLSDIREQISAKEREAKDTEIAPLASEMAIEKLKNTLTRIETSSVPNVSQLLQHREMGGGRRQGDVKFAQRYFGNGIEFEDGFGLLVWLMRPEIEKRLTAEIKKRANDEGAIPLEERPARLAAIRAEIIELETREEAVLKAIHGFHGRRDIQRRPFVSVEALLQIKRV